MQLANQDDVPLEQVAHILTTYRKHQHVLQTDKRIQNTHTSLMACNPASCGKNEIHAVVFACLFLEGVCLTGWCFTVSPVGQMAATHCRWHA